MKITIHSLDELYELSEVIAAGKYALEAARKPRGWEMTDSDVEQPIDELRKTFDKVSDFLDKRREPDATADDTTVCTMTDWTNPDAVVLSDSTSDSGTRHVVVAEVDDGADFPAAPELDADGRRWDARIDSSNKGLNKDGTWRARRNHGLSDEEVAAIKDETRLEADMETQDNAMGTPDDAAAAPAVTETHPLPVDEPETKPEPETTEDEDAELKATFFELVEQARKPAEDIQKDDIATTLQAAQAFTKAHNPHAFRLLRETITDKTLPGMTPGERRVLLAAMEMCKPGGEA